MVTHHNPSHGILLFGGQRGTILQGFSVIDWSTDFHPIITALAHTPA